jgi:hypothetical protein
MEVVFPFSDLLQSGLKAFQVSETIWLVPCTVNSNDAEYTPLIKPLSTESKQKSRHTWSKEEDDVLINIVNERGPKNWNLVARELNVLLYGNMTVRQGKQCRERWFNHLNPTLRKGNWRASEDIFILQKQIELGNRWSEIAKEMEGRTENSVKNRWKCMIKKANRRYPQADNVIDLILAERQQKLTENIEPSDSDSEGSHEVRQHSLEYDTLSNSDEVPFTLPSGHISFNSPRICTPSEPYADCRVDGNLSGFSQYAEYAKIFDASRNKPPGESDFSPSPSMFIRSPH